ncbi:succinate dehydrogenase subunit 8A, mitochondrial-like [Triticum dicoccoides]|nr:succinate dehydrogenase subunit 8A, mitochondrial-like [Triticum dicoccoides]
MPPAIWSCEGGGMIYRSWSLLSSTVAIWGGAAAAGLAVVSLSGGKEKFQDYLCREGDRLRRQDRATMASAN